MVDGLGEYRDIHSLCWEKGLVSLKIVYNFTLRLQLKFATNVKESFSFLTVYQQMKQEPWQAVSLEEILIVIHLRGTISKKTAALLLNLAGQGKGSVSMTENVAPILFVGKTIAIIFWDSRTTPIVANRQALMIPVLYFLHMRLFHQLAN